MLASYSNVRRIASLIILCGGAVACSTVSSQDEVQPIANPFRNFDRGQAEQASSLRFKTTHGDSSYEVAVPNSGDSDLVVPFEQNGSNGARAGMAQGGIDYRYQNARPVPADREIASIYQRNTDSDTESKREEIEAGLGLAGVLENGSVDQSYLAKIDVVKQLFKAARLEAALIELDRLVADYPNHSRLYEMRGTVLDRLGYTELAIKSWRQALEFDPSRVGLKKIIEKREQQRGIASERGKKR